MATRYVDVDTYLDAVEGAWVDGDTVTIRYGAILTQRDSSVKNFFQFTTTDSVIKFTTEQRKLTFDVGGYVDCVAGDIGKPVVAAGGDSGTLIDYDNATRVWHVLRDDPTDDQFDAAEACTITGGTGAGTMSTAAPQYLIVKFNATANSGIVVSAFGKLLIRGDWYPLGVGNGGAAQTFAFYGSEACPYVQVETGNGTGVFTDCKCVYSTLLTNYGAGVYMGNVFQHAPDGAIANITFGDGVNGLAPPNGAKVRCPDIFITSAAAYTATVTNRSRIYYLTTGGRHDWQNVMLSDRFYFYIVQAQYFYNTHVGSFAWCRVDGCPDIQGSHIVCAKDREVANQTSYLLYNWVGSVEYLEVETYGTSTTATTYAAVFAYGSSVYLSYLNCVMTQRQAIYSYSFSVSFANCQDLHVDHLIGQGGMIYANGCFSPIVFENVRYSDSPSGAKSILNNLMLMRFLNCGFFTINDVALLAGGSAPYSAVMSANTCMSGGVMTNVSFDADNRATYLCALDTSSKDIIVANCDMTGTLRSGTIYSSSIMIGCAFRNLTFGNALTTQIVGSKERVEGVMEGTLVTAFAASVDTMYMLTYTDATKTAGYIYLIMTPQNELNYYDCLAGDEDKSIYFDNAGLLYMKSIADSCTFEIPYLIQGVSSFQNVAATILHATWSANCTKEYAIKDGAYGSAWGAWTPFTPANLAAEVVDSTVGFYLKFRFTMVGAHATNNYCSRFMIPVDTDPLFSFPVGYVDLVLSGLVAGSRYWVYDNTNARELARGVAAGTSVTIDAPCEFDGAAISITVRVRHAEGAPYYDPWEVTTTYSDDGTTVAVAQRLSTVQTDVGEAFFTFDAVTQIGEVADTETAITVQQVVNAFREWESAHPEEAQLLETEGKGDLGAGLYTGILCRLINDWRLRFESRAGPGWVNCSVLAGDLIADNAYADDPIAPAAFVNVTRAMATSAALLDVGITVDLERIEKKVDDNQALILTR